MNKSDLILRQRIEEILAPAVNPKAPYANVMIDRLVDLVSPASPPADADRLRREGREDVLAMLSEDLAVELRDSLDRTLPLLSDDGEIAVREVASPPADAVTVDSFKWRCECGAENVVMCASCPQCHRVPPADADRTTGINLIAAERQRQIEREGWTPEHDDEHRDGEMAVSAARYALEDAGAPWPEPPAVHDAKTALREAWQWASCDWKPKDPIRNLARAGALIAAEIDRRLRVREAADALAISDQNSILDGREARQRMTRAPLTQQGAATTGEDARPAVGNVAKSQLDPSGAVASSTLPSSISPAARSREGAQVVEMAQRWLDRQKVKDGGELELDEGDCTMCGSCPRCSKRCDRNYRRLPMTDAEKDATARIAKRACSGAYPEGQIEFEIEQLVAEKDARIATLEQELADLTETLESRTKDLDQSEETMLTLSREKDALEAENRRFKDGMLSAMLHGRDQADQIVILEKIIKSCNQQTDIWAARYCDAKVALRETEAKKTAILVEIQTIKEWLENSDDADCDDGGACVAGVIERRLNILIKQNT